VYIPKKYAAALHNTHVDYTGQSLGQSMMQFSNPLAQGMCGCGESVNFPQAPEKLVWNGQASV